MYTNCPHGIVLVEGFVIRGGKTQLIVHPQLLKLPDSVPNNHTRPALSDMTTL